LNRKGTKARRLCDIEQEIRYSEFIYSKEKQVLYNQTMHTLTIEFLKSTKKLSPKKGWEVDIVRASLDELGLLTRWYPKVISKPDVNGNEALFGAFVRPIVSLEYSIVLFVTYYRTTVLGGDWVTFSLYCLSNQFINNNVGKFEHGFFLTDLIPWDLRAYDGIVDERDPSVLVNELELRDIIAKGMPIFYRIFAEDLVTYTWGLLNPTYKYSYLLFLDENGQARACWTSKFTENL
jgi:hypothetical protein